MNYAEMNKMLAEDKTINRVYAEIVRPDGTTETKDLTEKFGGMTATAAQRIKDATAKSGNGDVRRIYRKEVRTNAPKLERQWNNLFNEGGEGYVPDMTQDARFCAEVVTVEFL